MNELISVIIPTHRRPKDLEELINSLLAGVYRPIEIIIVDNSPEGGNHEVLQEDCQVSGVTCKLLKNKQKNALSRSRNMGAQAAEGNLLFFIDDDNVVSSDALVFLAKYMQSNNSCGIMSPVAYYYDQQDKVLDAGAKRSYLNSFTVNLYLNEQRKELPDQPFEVSEVSNAFMVKKQLFKEIGFFDEINFPIDLDEADFCLRAKTAGYRVMIAPEAVVYHKVSAIKSLAIASLRFRREENAYYMGRNRILFQKKHFPWWHYWAYLILYFPIFYGLYLFSSILPQPGTGIALRLKFFRIYTEGVATGFLMRV